MNILLAESTTSESSRILALLSDSYSNRQINILIAESVEEVIKTIEFTHIDILLLEYKLIVGNTYDLVQSIHDSKSELPIIIFTQDSSNDLKGLETGTSVQDFLTEPCLTTEIIKRSIQYSIESKKNKDSLARKKMLFSFLSLSNKAIVHSQNFNNLLNRIAEVAINTGVISQSLFILLDKSNNTKSYFSAGTIPAADLDINLELYNDQDENFLEKKTSLGKIIYTNSSLFCTFFDYLNLKHPRASIQSAAFIPIIDNNEISLYFNIFSGIEDLLRSDEIEMLEELADDINFAYQKDIKDKESILLNNQVSKNYSTLNSIIESTPNLIFSIDKEYNYTSFNQNHQRVMYGLYGYEIQIGYSILEYMTNLSDRAKAKSNLDKAISGERVIEAEWSGIPPHRMYFEVIHSPIVDYSGNIIGASVIARDLTVQKTAEENIRKEKQLSDLLIESLPGIFYMFDDKLQPVRWNKNKMTFLGLNEEEMKNHQILDSIADEDKQLLIESVTKVMTQGESSDIIRIIRHDGEIFSYQLTGKLLQTDLGNMLLGVGIDVTDRIKAEHELVIAKERAEQANLLKSYFLANISHELRTPLNGIMGFSEILTDESANEEARKMADMIHTSANRLLVTMNQIIDFSVIESNKINHVNLPLTLNDLIEEISYSYKVEAKEKDLYLNINIPEYEITILADQRLLTSIFNSLLSNALKFTISGGITVNLLIKSENFKDHAVIEVIDTGIGIDENDYDKIFEEFRQVSEGISRSFEGTGLGLTLTKKYVEILNGKVEIESKVNIGSTFRVVFPLLEKSGSEVPNKVIDMIEPVKQELVHLPNVLIVEDDLISSEITKLYLKNISNSWLATNGNDAINLALEHDFDLILMDINLGSGINGLEVTRFLRKNPKYENTPIIALTAYSMFGDKEEFLEAGCSHYLSKPFTRQQIKDLIDEVNKERN